MKNMLSKNSFWVAFACVILFISGYNTRDKVEKIKFSPDLEIIRKRIINDLLEPPVNEQKIQRLIQSINPGWKLAGNKLCGHHQNRFST